MGFGTEPCSLEKVGWLIVKSVTFILASFVFSLVFWLTKRYVYGEKIVKKKKK